MKKIIFISCVVLTQFCSNSTIAQSAKTYQSQRDSLQASYMVVLDAYDSVTIANAGLSKKLDQMAVQLRDLKNEIDNILKKKEESEAELSKAKKLIADPAALLEKLEAELKSHLNQKRQINKPVIIFGDHC